MSKKDKKYRFEVDLICTIETFDEFLSSYVLEDENMTVEIQGISSVTKSSEKVAERK